MPYNPLLPRPRSSLCIAMWRHASRWTTPSFPREPLSECVLVKRRRRREREMREGHAMYMQGLNTLSTSKCTCPKKIIQANKQAAWMSSSMRTACSVHLQVINISSIEDTHTQSTGCVCVAGGRPRHVRVPKGLFLLLLKRMISARCHAIYDACIHHIEARRGCHTSVRSRLPPDTTSAVFGIVVVPFFA